MSGATIWSRSTIESEIFFYKPDKWFKIWFYIVNRVNHQDTKLFKRGEALITYQEIMRSASTSKTVVHKCIKFLIQDNMLESRRTTRGVVYSVKNYDKYQKLDNYKTTSETTARQLADNSKVIPIVEECKEGKNVYKYISDLKDSDFLEIATLKKVSLPTVKKQFEALNDYCESTGKKYKNYKAALRNFVSKAIERDKSLVQTITNNPPPYPIDGAIQEPFDYSGKIQEIKAQLKIGVIPS